MTEAESKYRGSKAYHLVYAELLAAARYRGLLTYQEIGRLMGLQDLKGPNLGRKVGLLLGEISEDEVRQGRPMLSALVVSSASFEPGSGFYALARRLGRLTSDDRAAERAFWEAERKAVYETWATPM